MANFRENIAAGKLPLPSDVTFEGLCKEYYFDTAPRQAAEGVLESGGLGVCSPDGPPESRQCSKACMTAAVPLLLLAR